MFWLRRAVIYRELGFELKRIKEILGRPAKSRSLFRRWPSLKICRPASRRLRKATLPQIDRLKRVFEAHGMIVTGPPLD